MPANDSTAPTGLVIDQANHVIRFTRSFDAPAALVFEAWTRPEHLRCWWDAAGDPLAVCEIDLKPGGAFTFVSQSHPDQPFTGVYRDIAPPHRLVFEAMQSTGCVMLESAGGKTRLVVEIQCASAEQLEQFVKMGVANGTSQTLDNLVRYMLRQNMTA
jgi:uncharacterized protein YndB with AHSA1/START domain